MIHIKYRLSGDTEERSGYYIEAIHVVNSGTCIIVAPKDGEGRFIEVPLSCVRLDSVAFHREESISIGGKLYSARELNRKMMERKSV